MELPCPERPAGQPLARGRGRSAFKAAANGRIVRHVRLSGRFPWHRHEMGEQVFLVDRGILRLEFRDGVAALGAGEFIVVPKGVEHRVSAEDEVDLLVVDPAATHEPAARVAGQPREARMGKHGDERLRTPWKIRSGDCDVPGPASFPYQVTTGTAKGCGPRPMRPTKLG